MKPNAFADTVLIIGETELYTSSYNLSHASPVIAEKLADQNQIENKTETGRYVVPLSDISVESVIVLLEYLHPGPPRENFLAE